ncbi:MAG: adenylyltransferase/cytidyltransferase family protein [Fibrobacter sp.]|mgnify:CR=1 FL=1|jgi:glycerol-3-phosphate cytidylyltransferase|nr:adenylyltransferase/cytidyltransferase family protein [Fibrobacter sp.]
MKAYKRAITYGTFDLFHIGHLRLLERIASLAEEVVVAISSDEFNLLKNKVCSIPFEDRKDIVAALRVVTKVIKEDNWEQKIIDIQNENCDLFVMGDDWKGKFDFLKAYCEVLYLPRTEGVSTTEIKEWLKA